ncbi:hypothetical protein OPQ81_003925 [Rhizoctonia solani]|nr:hypothetical protein OPQ81_003925 [Rhizoctonia solani]
MFELRQIAITKRIQELDVQIATAEEELRRVRGGSYAGTQGQKRAIKIIVTVLTETDGPAELVLRYAVSDASWTPLYDMHVSIANSPDESYTIALHYHASIAQSTGENWPDVALTLSTASPQLGNCMPKPSSRRIGRELVFCAAAAKAALELLFGARVHRKQRLTDVSNMQSQKAKVSHTGILSTPFVIPGRSDIPSDGASHKVDIHVLNLKAELEWIRIPRENEGVFLGSKVTNTSELTLLPGEVNVFMDDTFMSKSRIEFVPPNKSFKISFGVDSALPIRYPLAKAINRRLKSEFAFINKIKRWLNSQSQRITILNSRSTPVSSLQVLDHILVSTDVPIKANPVSPQQLEMVAPDKERPLACVRNGGNAPWAPLNVGAEGSVDPLPDDWQRAYDNNPRLDEFDDREFANSIGTFHDVASPSSPEELQGVGCHPSSTGLPNDLRHGTAVQLTYTSTQALHGTADALGHSNPTERLSPTPGAIHHTSRQMSLAHNTPFPHPLQGDPSVQPTSLTFESTAVTTFLTSGSSGGLIQELSVSERTSTIATRDNEFEGQEFAHSMGISDHSFSYNYPMGFRTNSNQPIHPITVRPPDLTLGSASLPFHEESGLVAYPPSSTDLASDFNHGTTIQLTDMSTQVSQPLYGTTGTLGHSNPPELLFSGPGAMVHTTTQMSLAHNTAFPHRLQEDLSAPPIPSTLQSAAVDTLYTSGSSGGLIQDPSVWEGTAIIATLDNCPDSRNKQTGMPPETWKKRCPTCGKFFDPKPSSWNRHQDIHSGITRFMCTYPNCGEKKRTKDQVVIHVFNHHMKEKPVNGTSPSGEQRRRAEHYVGLVDIDQIDNNL